MQRSQNPYQSPKYTGSSFEALLDEGEEVLFQIAARSLSKKSWFFRLCNTEIGKFIVTNRRLMFLSSGTSGTFGVTHISMVVRIAESVDLASLCRRTSWEFEMTKVRSVEASNRLLWGEPSPHLQLVGTETCGMEVTHRIYPYGVKRKTWKELLTRIRQMMEGSTL